MRPSRRALGLRSVITLLFLTTGTHPLLLGQQPSIKRDRIVNSASLALNPASGPELAPGGIFTIFGENLAVDTLSATGSPLPTSLAGTIVTVAGRPAPLVSVSPGSITFQAPASLVPHTTDPNIVAAIVVTNPLGASDPVQVPYAYAVPGLYTQSGIGCGIGLVNNETPAGLITLNSQENSASPGDFISIFGTGFGLAGVSLSDGEALPQGAEARLQLGAGLLLGPAGFERTVSPPPNTVPPWYKGRAPGLVGIDQLKFQLPLDAPEGCAVPLKAIGGSFKFSQPVTISIHRGGGTCQDPPPSRKGIFYWTKIIQNGEAYSIDDTFEALFTEAPAGQLTGQQQPTAAPRGPQCPGTAGRGLDAGQLQVTDRFGNLYNLTPSMITGKLTYLPLILPPGAIGPGTISVSASGGSDIDAFQSQLSLPEPIEIEKLNLLPGTQISMSKPLTVTWTGGTADLLVRVRLGYAYGRVDASYYERSTTGDKGSLTLTPTKSGNLTYFPGVASGPGLSVTVLVSPVTPSQSITLPGFDEPVPQNWTYVLSFTDLVQGN